MSRKPVPARLPLGDDKKIRPTFARERAAMRRGFVPFAGCDEAGGGPRAWTVAKVRRGRLRGQRGLAQPGYGSERHMGYCGPEHIAALGRLGPTTPHRRSFAPVALLLGVPAVETDQVATGLLPL